MVVVCGFEIFQSVFSFVSFIEYCYQLSLYDLLNTCNNYDNMTGKY